MTNPSISCPSCLVWLPRLIVLTLAARNSDAQAATPETSEEVNSEAPSAAVDQEASDAGKSAEEIREKLKARAEAAKKKKGASKGTPAAAAAAAAAAEAKKRAETGKKKKDKSHYNQQPS